MSDFKKIQGELQKAKRNREQSRRVLFLAKERLGKLEREKAGILRKDTINSEAFKLLSQNERRLKADLTKAEEQLAEVNKVEQSLLDDFRIFVDPPKTIQQFSDDTPFLLFPVRLETRFKKIKINEREIQHQLWVRVFPDDCSVDTFENVLSEAEIKRAKNYWLTIWSAGKSVDDSLKPFILNQQKAAWKGLAGNIQAGRAYWITKNFIPENSDDLPERESEDDIILTISTEELPNEAVQTALETYWTAIWLANGKAELSSAAHSELVATVGEDQASEILLNYIPFNLKDRLPPQKAPFPRIKIAFIQFDKIDTIDSKLSSWSQAARVTTLPDKFVLLGYKGKDAKGQPIEVVNEPGEVIPDPLIIGPNPSLDTNTVLKKSLVEDYMSLGTDELKKARLTTYYQESKASIQAEKTLDQFINNPELLDEDTTLAALEQIFEDLKDEVKAVKYIDYLCQKSETKWLFDFDEAVKVGMGFKINLNSDLYDEGFDRLFVLGVKLSADEMEAKTALEELFEHHHFGSSGFSIMAQGTATNNTEDEKSGFSENEDFEETYQRYILESTEDDPDDFSTRKDGQWLSSLLGIDADKSSIKLAENYYQTDQCEAKAMNTAMWSGTIKYFMESMMTPVFNEQDEQVAHSFFTGFVSGRGSIPAIRIGDQPYGILATNTLSRQNWLFQKGDENTLSLSQFGNSISVLQKLNKLLNKVREDFDQFSEQAAHIGKEGDAHQILLDVIGLHASSVEFHQRYAKSFAHLYNLWFFYLFPSFYNIYTEKDYQNRGLELLRELGYFHSEKDDDIPILEKFFLSASNQLKGDLIDDQPLSEETPIRPYTVTESENEVGKNYIYWLIENALSDYNKIKKQQGFAEHAPTALLYQMLRHALELEFSNTALNLHKNAEILNSNQVALAKKDADFIGIQARQTPVFESKYDYLDRHESKIKDKNISVAEHISTLLQESTPSNNTNRLEGIIKALNHLKDVPTAQLERAFVEHLDCCTYRLDAWLLGFVNLQLISMR